MNPINPWKKLSSRYVYTNPWIKVREDQVITPSGEEGIYGVVETKLAVGVVALTEDDQLYLVGQYRYPHDQYSWEIIEGGGEEGEDPLETAKRELREEAGLLAENWIQLGADFHISNCFSSETGIIYLARDLTETDAEPDDTEVLEVKKLPMTEALDLAHSGEIKDSITLIALQRLERWLNHNKKQ